MCFCALVLRRIHTTNCHLHLLFDFCYHHPTPIHPSPQPFTLIHSSSRTASCDHLHNFGYTSHVHRPFKVIKKKKANPMTTFSLIFKEPSFDQSKKKQAKIKENLCVFLFCLLSMFVSRLFSFYAYYFLFLLFPFYFCICCCDFFRSCLSVYYF